MKRILSTAIGLLAFVSANAQTTYYWVGGTDVATVDFRLKTNWSTSLGGSPVTGTGNITLSSTVYLVYDGSNLGTGANNAVPIVANVNGGTTIGQLKVTNGAKVVFQRGSTTGTSTFIINGDNTADDDFVVGTNSAVTITGATSGSTGYGITLQLGIAGTAVATGLVSGTVNILGNYVNRIYPQNTGALIFASGSTCKVNSTSAYYILGISGASAEGGTIFQSASTLIYQSGYSVFGNNSTFNAISLQNGSNFIFETANAANMFASRYFGNVIIRNNAAVAADGAFYNIDSLAIETGASLALNPSAQSPISGSITNNGTLSINGIATSAVLVMNGSTPKTIGGSGTYALNKITIGTDVHVTLQSNIAISDNLLVEGRLNLQSNVISGGGSFETKSASTDIVTGDITSGSYTVNNITPATPVATIGCKVTGTGIQPNTYIIYSLSNGTWILSKPATTTSTSVSLTSTRAAGVITSSSANGLDGNLTITGTKILDANTSYVFNAPTTAPFPVSANTIIAKSITIDGNVALNRNISITDSLILTSGNLTVPTGDTLILNTNSVISGTGFNSSKHIVTEANTATGAKGVLQVNNAIGTQLFPIGSAGNYLPVTLTPSVAESYYLNVFEGLTNNGAPDGTTIASVNDVVNAVWNINRASSTNPCTVTLGWPSSLEGINFANLSNSQIGITHFNGTAWDAAIGNGDNTANTATATFISFSPFSVGQVGVPLPLFILNEKTTLEGTTAKISWETATEKNALEFIIEKSIDGKSFHEIGTVKARGGNSNTYLFNDDRVQNGLSFYRLKVEELSGEIVYSKTMTVVSYATMNNQITLYPNPTKDQLTIISNNKEAKDAIIMDVAGKVIQHFSLNPGQNVLNVNHLNPGVYFIKTGTQESHRLIVK